MASIVDLFFTGRLDDGPLQVDAKKAGEKAGLTLGSRLSTGLKTGSRDLVSGLKLGAGIAAFGGLEGAVSGVISVLGDAVQAARDDEESQTRLAASLKANIPNWNGNTTAIEATILARQRLGFTDEELRKSLALLVVATHDVTKAQQIQATAMDLARLKGISLEEASAALIKVEGGQYRALKALGIQLPKNATATEALAAVQAAAQGSAEAFANTSSGKLLVSQIKVSEAMEKLGYIIMPAVATVTESVAAVTVTLAEAAATLGQAVSNTVAQFAPLINVLGQANDWLGQVGQQVPLVAGAFDLVSHAVTLPVQPLFFLKDRFDDLTRSQDPAQAALAATDRSLDSVALHTKAAGKDVRDDGQRIGGYIELIGRKAGSAEDQVAAAMKGIVSDVQDARSQLGAAAQGAADAIYDPIIAGAERAQIIRDIAEQQQIISSKKSTAAQVADAQARMLELKKSQITNLATLASYGDRSATATLQHMIDVLASTQNLSREQRVELGLLRAALRQTTTAYQNTAAAARMLAYMSGHNKDDTALPVHRAAGGSLMAGQASWVGELGPELMVPRTPVTVLSHADSMAASGGGGTTIHLSTYGMPTRADTPFEVVTQLRRASRLGVIAPTRRPAWNPNG